MVVNKLDSTKDKKEQGKKEQVVVKNEKSDSAVRKNSIISKVNTSAATPKVSASKPVVAPKKATAKKKSNTKKIVVRNVPKKKEPFLSDKSIIEVVATGGHPDSDQSDPDCINVINSIRKYAVSYGYMIRFGDGIFSNNDEFYANTDEERARMLVDALTAKDSKVVWPVRGGYGTFRILPFLDKMLPATIPNKVVLGCGDTSILQNYLKSKYNNVTCLHSPLLIQLVNGYTNAESEYRLMEILRGNADTTHHILHSYNRKYDGIKISNTEIVGGNINSVVRSLGTPYKINTKGKILFLEGFDETPIKVEYMLTHLSQAGLFNGVKGIIFGAFPVPKPEGVQISYDNQRVGYASYIAKVLYERFVEGLGISVPVFYTHSVGHGIINNVLPLYAEASINKKVLSCKVR